MSLDPGKVSEELSSVWRASPLIVGTQLIIIGLVGFIAWDRYIQRSGTVAFVERLMTEQRERTERLESHLDDLHGELVNCYRHVDEEREGPHR